MKIAVAFLLVTATLYAGSITAVGDVMLGADSLDTVELVMAVEDEFDITIENEDAEKLRTVQDALCYLCEKML